MARNELDSSPSGFKVILLERLSSHLRAASRRKGDAVWQLMAVLSSSLRCSRGLKPLAQCAGLEGHRGRVSEGQPMRWVPCPQGSGAEGPHTARCAGEPPGHPASHHLSQNMSPCPWNLIHCGLQVKKQEKAYKGKGRPRSHRVFRPPTDPSQSKVWRVACYQQHGLGKSYSCSGAAGSLDRNLHHRDNHRTCWKSE